jgi:membrane protease YdiL (CAAX protease family)
MTADGPTSPSPSAPSSWQRRLAAVLEVVGVFLAGTLLARLASRGLHLGPANLRALGADQPPDFLRLSGTTAANLLLRYGCILGLGLAVGWWHRRRRPADYGITAAGRPLRAHLAAGLLLFAAAGLPAFLLKFLSGILPLGARPEHWSRIQSLDDPALWLYLLVGSFGLVPILEELFFRGYAQSRLTEDLGAPAAILLTALFFTFSHTQYFIAGAVGAGMLASLLVSSFAAGYVRSRTGSLLPVIVAHALGNLPFRGWGEAAALVAMVLCVVIWRRAVAKAARGLWRDAIARLSVVVVAQAVLVLAVLLALVMLGRTLLPAFAALALAVALVIEFREKRQSPRSDSIGSTFDARRAGR